LVYYITIKAQQAYSKNKKKEVFMVKFELTYVLENGEVHTVKADHDSIILYVLTHADEITLDTFTSLVKVEEADEVAKPEEYAPRHCNAADWNAFGDYSAYVKNFDEEYEEVEETEPSPYEALLTEALSYFRNGR
jgi:hypothetical protein